MRISLGPTDSSTSGFIGRCSVGGLWGNQESLAQESRAFVDLITRKLERKLPERNSKA